MDRLDSDLSTGQSYSALFFTNRNVPRTLLSLPVVNFHRYFSKGLSEVS